MANVFCVTSALLLTLFPVSYWTTTAPVSTASSNESRSPENQNRNDVIIPFQQYLYVPDNVLTYLFVSWSKKPFWIASVTGICSWVPGSRTVSTVEGRDSRVNSTEITPTLRFISGATCSVVDRSTEMTSYNHYFITFM